MALRNLRFGRGDRKGAGRVAMVLTAASFGSWVLGAHPVPSIMEFLYLTAGLGGATLMGGFSYLSYIAIEPYLRRLWPGLLVSWSRFLEGRFRDPLVGRHLLVGALWGVSSDLIWRSGVFVIQALGQEQAYIPFNLSGTPVLGFSRALAAQLASMGVASLCALLVLGFLLTLHLLLRRRWLVVPAFSIVMFFVAATGTLSTTATGWSVIAMTTLVTLGYMLVIFRAGLLATVVSAQVMLILRTQPLTLDVSAWYFGFSLTALLVVLAIGVFGLTLGGRSLLGDELADV